jgi:hypothetical protein
MCITDRCNDAEVTTGNIGEVPLPKHQMTGGFSRYLKRFIMDSRFLPIHDLYPGTGFYKNFHGLHEQSHRLYKHLAAQTRTSTIRPLKAFLRPNRVLSRSLQAASLHLKALSRPLQASSRQAL